MCGFVGFCNINYDISSQKNTETIKVLTRTLTNVSPDDENIYVSKNICLGHKKLIVSNSENIKHLFSFKYNDNTYTILYNGKLYNATDIRNKLIKLGYVFNRIF